MVVVGGADMFQILCEQKKINKSYHLRRGDSEVLNRISDGAGQHQHSLATGTKTQLEQVLLKLNLKSWRREIAAVEQLCFMFSLAPVVLSVSGIGSVVSLTVNSHLLFLLLPPLQLTVFVEHKTPLCVAVMMLL